jgi:hypothetical protein
VRAGAAGDVHDARFRATAQERQQRLSQPPCAEQVGLQHHPRGVEVRAAPGLGPVDERRGVVHKDVKAARVGADRVDDSAHRVGIGQVQRRQRGDARSQLFRRLCGGRRVASADQHRVAPLGELAGHLPTEAVGGAGHQRTGVEGVIVIHAAWRSRPPVSRPGIWPTYVSASANVADDSASLAGRRATPASCEPGRGISLRARLLLQTTIVVS